MLIIMAAMFFLGVSATDIYLSSLPQMVAEFQTTPRQVNLTITLFNVAVAVFVLVVGEVSSRYGRKPIILIGMLAFSGAALAIAVISNLSLIIALRFIQGFGCAVIVIVCRLVLKDSMTQHEQIRANGILLIGLILSPALAPVLGAFLAKYWGWRSCFLVSGGCGLLLTMLVWRFIPETNRQPLAQFAPVAHYLHIYAQLLRNRLFWALTAMYAGALGAYFVFIGISSYLYINFWQIKPYYYSLLFIWLALSYLLGNQIMQYLNQRCYSSERMIYVGVIATAAGGGILALSLVGGPTWLPISLVTISIFLMRTANAIINPPTQIRIMNDFNQISAQALGLNMCIGFMTGGIAVALVASFTKHPLVDLVLCADLFVAIAVIACWFNRKLLVSKE